MGRYLNIAAVTFGETSLPLPLSVRISRQGQPDVIGGDSDEFATSIQLGRPAILAEVRIRDTATAEGLSLGQQATLSITVKPAGPGQAERIITITGAVLVAVEISYEQTSMASAALRFIAESASGIVDPFSAEESS